MVYLNEMAKLSTDDVLKLAKLARLRLDETEATTMLAEINDILGYVETLQSVDVSGFEPTIQVGDLQNVMREDQVIDYQASADALLETAPNKQDRLIEVKRVLQ